MDYIDEAIARLEAEGTKQQEVTQAPPGKTAFEEYAPVAGSLIGGLAVMSRTGNPTLLQQAGRSALGTGIGTSIGQSASQISRQLGGEEIPFNQLIQEQATEVGKQTAADLAGSAIGSGLVKGYRALRPLTPDPKLVKAQEELQKRGATLSLGQAKPDSFASFLEGATRQTASGKMTFEKLHKQQDVALKQMREELNPMVDAVPISRVGSTVKDAIAGGYSGLSDIVKPMYEDISLRAAAKNVFVDTLPVQKTAQKILDQQARLGGVGLTEQGGTILQRVVKGDNTLSFSDAQQLRSDLLARSRMLEDGDPAKKNITDLVKHVTAQMEEGAKLAGSDVYADLMKVNSFYRKSQSKLGDEFVAKLVNKRPSEVVDTIIAAGNEAEISALKIALKRAEGLGGTSYKETWGKIQQHYLDNMLSSKGILTKEGETIGTQLLKGFTDPKISRTMNKVLDKEQISALKSFAETSLAAQTMPKSQNSVLIPMIQAGALIDLLTFRFVNPATSSAIVFGPSALGKMLTDPNRVNLTLQILKNPTAPYSPKLLSKFAANIDWANKEVEKEGKAKEQEEYEQLLRSLK